LGRYFSEWCVIWLWTFFFHHAATRSSSQFLRFEDFGLLLVLGGATGLTMLFYQFAPGLLKKPLLMGEFSSKPDGALKKTLTGAAIFGIGWGLCGVCPGPAIAGIGAGNWPVLYALIAMFAGAYVQGRWFSGN